MTEEQYVKNKKRIECLMRLDPYPDTELGQELERLVFEVAAFEKVILKQVADVAGISGDFKVFKLKSDKDFLND